ncbi:MAG TPA: hypothetical protein VFE59_35115 [Trebonia sp.]|jgi:hypothetical protein|nr:hypothetical protein [Trebonia sp.]
MLIVLVMPAGNTYKAGSLRKEMQRQGHAGLKEAIRISGIRIHLAPQPAINVCRLPEIYGTRDFDPRHDQGFAAGSPR